MQFTIFNLAVPTNDEHKNHVLLYSSHSPDWNETLSNVGIEERRVGLSWGEEKTTIFVSCYATTLKLKLKIHILAFAKTCHTKVKARDLCVVNEIKSILGDRLLLDLNIKKLFSKFIFNFNISSISWGYIREYSNSIRRPIIVVIIIIKSPPDEHSFFFCIINCSGDESEMDETSRKSRRSIVILSIIKINKLFVCKFIFFVYTTFIYLSLFFFFLYFFSTLNNTEESFTQVRAVEWSEWLTVHSCWNGSFGASFEWLIIF